MIYLISQVTFIFLIQIYYNMNFITSSSNFITRISLALWDQSLSTASGGLFFVAHKKMHISEYVCKTCLKELGILLKCSETFEKFLTSCNFLKILVFQNFFSKFRSNRQRRSVKKGVLRNFAKLTGKNLCQSLFFNKVVGTGVFLWILRNF